ncbi:MAG: hypothetical protein RL398_308 [Planctomycetota bacterium]|jgi:hypothetical protein
MRRWLWFALLGPQLFPLTAWLAEAGLPRLEAGVLVCMYLALFADRRALPWLLFGAAIGRALVIDAPVPVHMLVMGVPAALLVPLRALLYGHRWTWQVAVAAAAAAMVPLGDGLCARWFGGPPAPTIELWRIALTAVVLPPLLAVLRRLPPLASFEEAAA